MKKLFCVFFSFVIFSCCSLTTYATVDLSKSSLVDTKVVLGDKVNLNFKSFIDFFLSCFNSVIEYNARKVEAARGAYFYFMLINHLSCSSPILNDSQTTFCDEYLDYYFNQYWTAETNLDEYYSDFDVFMQAGGFDDVPFSLKKLRFQDTNFAASGGLTDNQLKKVAIDSFKSYYNTMMARFLLANNIAGIVDPAPGKNGLEIAPAYVSSDELIEGLERDNKMFYPKDYKAQITYRTDEYFQKYCNFPDTARTETYKPYIMDNARFVGTGDAEKLYFILYYNEDGLKYYSEYQFCLYFKVEVEYDESGSAVGVKKMPCLKYWSAIDGSEDESTVFYESDSDCSELKYFFIDLHYSSSYFRLIGYKTFTDFLKGVNSTTFSKAYFTNTLDTLYIPDLSQSEEYVMAIDGRSSHKFCGNYINHDSDCRYNANCDIGLFVDSKPIEFTWRDIDTSKIGKGQVVTINGDTIYNYTITNPETGDSSKFGDYITNNYTYITNNNGGTSGGTVGGNVTVDGKIDVGGSVAVDVNVNVNGAGGSGNVNPSDFTSADNVDLTKYYDNAVEQSTGFQKFLKAFFDFLPPELLALLLFAVSMAIVCRVFGR